MIDMILLYTLHKNSSPINLNLWYWVCYSYNKWLLYDIFYDIVYYLNYVNKIIIYYNIISYSINNVYINLIELVICT